MRSKLHIYGYGSNTSGETAAASYVDGNAITPDYVEGTDANMYETRNNKFIGYVGTGTTNTDLSTAPTAMFPVTGEGAGGETGQTEIYHFYLAW